MSQATNSDPKRIADYIPSYWPIFVALVGAIYIVGASTATNTEINQFQDRRLSSIDARLDRLESIDRRLGRIEGRLGIPQETK